MQELVLTDLEVPDDDIFHDRKDFAFRQAFSLFEVGTEIPLRAEFRDDVAVGGLPDNFVASEDVGVFEFGEGLDLAVEHLATDCILDSTHIDGLDGNGFI